MKRIIFIFTIIFILFAGQAQAFDFYVFGINLKWFKNAEPKDYIAMFSGAFAGLIIHETSHYGYAKLHNLDIQYHGIHYDLYNANKRDQVNTAKAGYYIQSLVGIALTSFEKTRNTYFTKGYTSFEAATLPFYNSVFDGKYNDFKIIRDNGGNEDTFFYTISAISLHNILRQKW